MSQIPDPSNPSPNNPGIPPAVHPLPFAPPIGAGTYMGAPPTKDEQSMGMLCYILGIFGLLGWVGPLIIWQTRKDSAFINDQAKEVLNWELTIIPIYLLVMVTFCIPIVNILGFLCFFATLITNLVFCIIGAVKASQGVAYRMPFSIKYVK
ncbi:MAG TPA: DUF4870 domain-containing protein [Tepidisphaeraceae bacterium]|nr:DUF4870 domain-containing protein [Tepidisphaeraceae bacterium]